MKLKLDIPLFDLDGVAIVRPESVGSSKTIPAVVGAVIADSLLADSEGRRGTATSRFDNYLLAKRLKMALRETSPTVEVSIEELNEIKTVVAEVFAHNKTVHGAVWEVLEGSKPVKLVEDKKDA